MTCKILLASTVGWPSVARLAHGFAAASCDVDVLAPKGSVVFESRYVDRKHIYAALTPRAALRNAISASRPDLIVACDDRAVAQMLDLYSKSVGMEPVISEAIARSLGEPSSYPEMVSRHGFMKRAEALGIRVPQTCTISDETDLDGAIDQAELPIVVKADGSWGGEGVIVARSRAAAHAAFRRLGRAPSRVRSLVRAVRRADAHHIVAAFAPSAVAVSAQQFIAGKPAACAIACWRGEILGAIYYDVLVAQGEIGPPNVIKRVDCPQMEQAARKIAAHYRLTGIHGMDFIRDAAGAVHLIEINPRATQGSTLAFGPGRDLPAALVSRIASGQRMRTPIANDIVAIFPREWQRDPSSPWLSSAHHDVPWDDPAVLLASLRSTRTAPVPRPCEPANHGVGRHAGLA